MQLFSFDYLGMGTKVQCKSYSPVYYSMRDLNEDANRGSWPLYYDDKILKSEQYYNCFMTKSRMDAYPEHDKEVLKQTMLEHETVFRNQVYELHRLYRTQRDLMNELKRKELHKYPRPVEASQSSPFSSQIPSEDAKKMWQIPSFPLASSSCSRPSISGAESMQSPLNFIKESSMQATPYPVQNGGTSKEHESLESKSKEVPRRMFDLQLPADEYLDSEGERIEEEKVSHASSEAGYPLKGNCRVAPVIDVKLSLGSSGNPNCQGDASKSDSRLWNRHGLADLNQPVQVEETTTPAPVTFLGTAAHCGEIQRQDLPAKPNYPGFPREFFQGMQKDRNLGSHINDLRLENEGKRERPYNIEAGQSSRGNFNSFHQGSCSEKLPTQLESAQVDFKRIHEHPAFSVCDYNKREPWRERAVCGIEITQSSQSLSNYNYLGSVLEPRIPSSYPVVPQSVDNSESSSVLSWIKPMNNFGEKSTEVKALPCLNSSSLFNKSSKSSVQNPVLIGNEWHFNSNRPSSSSGREISYRNGFCHGSQSESNASRGHFPSVRFDFLNGHINNNSALEHSENHSPTKYFRGSDCMDVKSAKGMNLNLALPNGFQDEEVRQHDLVIIDGEGKNEDPPQGLPWLRGKSASDNAPAKGKGRLNETGVSYASETRSVKVANCPDNRKILGFPIFDKSHISKDQNSLSSPSKFQYPSEVEEIKNSGNVFNIDLSRDPAKPESESKLSSENLKGLDIDRSGFRTDINLNLCIDEEENPSLPYIPRSNVKIAVEIDLEAPVLPEILEGIPRNGDCSTDQLRSCVQSSPTWTDPLEELERIASEAIVFMSSSNNLETSSFKSSEGSLKDSLNWFADVVSLNMADLESESGVISRDNDESSEFDYFESMTLKLTETKLDEVSCKFWVPENPKEEETGNSSLLTRRRRGQSRRGRQRRDFQRDILPGLASLSRHEVTEDLQTFGGLMRATGHPWQSGSTRRNGARNGWARGRKRTQGPAPTVICSPPREQPNNIEVGFEERSLKGWGKTTRRPRRQRLPAGSPIPLTQV
ncbi:Protein of unknown function DUF863 [Macleaya cordata]|uniref:Uncharacterized protein n=1 Tax=Macleaya cordata TaxID=56857 RepID=A0A200PR77_MACCD|nr:Protein of unknown function DUF863 [Macleaya cordata]